MKINKILLGAFALSMTFASCSNDEPANGGDSNVTDGDRYMAVKIRTAGLGSSRTATVGSPNEFEEGTPQESSIDAKDLRFLFFDEKGNAFPLAHGNIDGTVVSNMVIPDEITTEKGPGEIKEIVGTLVLGNGAGSYKGEVPSQVLVVANGDPTRISALENKNLTAVLGTPSLAPLAWDATSKFLMTSSVYYDAEKKLVKAVEIPKSKVATTATAAENDPLVIHIERVAAKVRASYNDSYNVLNRNDATNNEFQFYDYDPTKKDLVGSKVKFIAEIVGWQLLNKASQANAFKELPKTYQEAEELLGENNATNWVWNDDTRFRSYWAISNAGTKFQDDYNNYDLTTTAAEKYGSYTKNALDCAYCYENTGFYNDANIKENTRGTFATAIAIKAKIKKVGDTEPTTIFRYADNYYSKNAIEHLIKTRYVALHPEAEGYESQFVIDYVDNKAEDNTFTPTVTYKGSTESITQYSTILKWDNGVTSYYLNVMHLNNKPGVVRNHIYDYKFDAIYGLGVPGSEPGTPVLTESYVAARVYILNWHVVSNNVTLE